MIPFLFSKTFNIVNDKQTTDEQHEYFLIMMELFRQRTTCCVDCTIHEVYISFQISRKVLIDLSASTIHAQRKCLFLLTLQTIHWLFSLLVRTGHDGCKTLRQYRQLRRLGPTSDKCPGGGVHGHPWNRTSAWWWYLITTTRIHFGFALLFKFVNPVED